MSDRVDNELRRVSTALAAVSPPKPELPKHAESTKRRRPILVAAAAFVLVLGLGVGAGLLFGNQDEPPTAGPIVLVPEGHIAREVVDANVLFDEVIDFVWERGALALCGEGGGASVCVIWEDGVAVIVPFALPDGTVTEWNSSALEERVELELEVGELVAVAHEAGTFRLMHRIPGEDSPRSYSSEFPPASDP